MGRAAALRARAGPVIWLHAPAMLMLAASNAASAEYVRLDVCKPELVAKMWGNPVDYVLVSKGRPILIHQSKHKGCSRLVFGANASVEVLGELHTIKNLIGD